jgi:aminoglycoside 3-N-acetyltransferase I
MEIKVLRQDEREMFVSLIELFNEVFEMKNFVRPGDGHLSKLLARDDFFAVVAILEGRVVGGLTVYILEQYYSTKPLAYIFDLAVLTTHQRRGIGAALIRFTNSFCKDHGFAEVFVQADKVDGYALEFYRSTGPSVEEDVSHFYYTLDDPDATPPL